MSSSSALCSFHDIDEERDFYNMFANDAIFYQICDCKKHLWSKRAQRVIKADADGFFLITGSVSRYKAFVKIATNYKYETEAEAEAVKKTHKPSVNTLTLTLFFLFAATIAFAYAWHDDVGVAQAQAMAWLHSLIFAVREKMMQFLV